MSFAVAGQERDALAGERADDRVAGGLSVRRIDVMALDVLEPRKPVQAGSADHRKLDAHASTA